MLPFENIKYQHVERWDTEEVEYLKEIPELVAQPKIDGTNGLVVCTVNSRGECCQVEPGSRNRYLTVEDDNEGFAKYVSENYDSFGKAAEEIWSKTENPTYVIFYGEFTKKGKFLVKPEFFHNFYVFDVVTMTDCVNKNYHDPVMFFDTFEKYNIGRVPSYPISGTVLKEKGEDYLKEELKDFSRFLMQDQFQTGEGFVIKTYSEHRNKYGRQTWAKILYDRPRSPADDLYNDVLENWFDLAFLDKEYIKYTETFSKEPFNIQKFSNIVVREFIKEEIANIVFKKKMPVIDFARLYKLLIHKANNYARAKLGMFKTGDSDATGN